MPRSRKGVQQRASAHGCLQCLHQPCVRPLRGERIADAVTPRRPPLPPLLSGDFPTWLAYQKDPNDTPFMVQSRYGREHFPNGSAYLARFALTGSVYGGPPSLELIELDAQDDRVFAKLHITAPAGFEWDVYQVIDMDPEPAYDAESPTSSSPY